ncbi:MAG: class I SAM-dependent DNA methyltransferase [Synergistaceae bacterium]|nr:class I SAM-dependent DNA methyltransferase [Synergistaceae bacterium]
MPQIRKFIDEWSGKGDEKSDTQKFWLELLRYVCGVGEPESLIEFEKRVELEHKSFIDAYINKTKIIIEQKSIDIDLGKAAKQSDGSLLTPYDQAKRYYDWLPVSERGRWIITCNFKEFWIYDMEQPRAKPEIIEFANLEHEWPKLQILVDSNAATPAEIKELELSIRAGELVRKLYEAVLPRYRDPNSPEALRGLNIFCVRVVFLLYAEDAGLLNRDEFYKYLNLNQHNARCALICLFKILSQPEDKRDPYINKELKAFPYVDGSLFEEDGIEIPNLNEPDDEPVKIILDDMSNGFDWSGINPTIFGALFEDTLNPETRSKNGMHYTSIENIHRVIDPLFFESLKHELDAIINLPANPKRNKELAKFQNKLAGLKFLDPACGSGNFLTETYLSLRHLENKILKELDATGQIKMIFSVDESPVKVSINQFYGIEINDFAVAVAKTALWIAEHQMIRETQYILRDFYSNYLPLKTYANITETNALKIDWHEIIKPSELNYIMGNPPFRGYSSQTAEQKSDMLSVYVDEAGRPYNSAGKIDYVAAWYFKAAEFIQSTKIRAAFVSTNSITQGEQVSAVWRPLLERFNIKINFAWRPFKWQSESTDMAQVHIVIIGFSCNEDNNKTLFEVVEADDDDKSENKAKSDGEAEAEDESKFKVESTSALNINPYLSDAETIFIKPRRRPLCDVPEMRSGNRPADGGKLLLTPEEREELIQKEPQAEKFIKRFMGSKEFINNIKRYCLWLVDVSPDEIRNMKHVHKRVLACKKDRLKGAPDRQKLAATPHLFREQLNPEIYITIPETSSENRPYIPIGWLNSEVIPGNSLKILPEATLYHFGILTSRVHMAWMRAVAGRLEISYRYSVNIVYNNFPWPEPNAKQLSKIETAAQKILDARALYPTSSFDALYDDVVMPIELRKAHKLNDAAVCEAYGFDKKISENEIVANLMRLYQELQLICYT